MTGNVRLRFVVGLAIIVVQVLSGAAMQSPDSVLAQDAIGASTVVANRFIVRMKPTTNLSAWSVASSYDSRPGVTIDQVYTSVFSGFAGEFSNAAALDLARDPNVLDVFPDRLSYLAAQTNPPGIDRVDADLNTTKAGNGSGSVDVDIAILDTGIYKHSDLNVVGGKDCTISKISGPYHDISGHGTHVAGTAAAKDNGSGVVGVAPGARLWAVKIFSDDGGGAARESEVICALDYVRANAATIEVINLSIGADYGYDLGGCGATVYHQAYCNVVNSGVTVVAAAQNWTINARTIVPAQFDEVITVSAYYDEDGLRGGLGDVSDCTPRGGTKGVQDDDTFACFSNFGHDIDISAPGMDVLSTYSLDAEPDPDYCPSSLYCEMSGTSMATPHVAGAVGLIQAQQGRMSPAAVKARLLITAEPGPVPLDPDGIEEPMLNVGQLGAGAIDAPGSSKVGQRVTVDVEEFTPGTRAIFRLNGTYVGGDTIGDDGDGSRTFTVPATPAMLQKMTVSNGQKTVSAFIDIKPLMIVEPGTGPVGETVNVRLRGFGTAESVVIWFDTGGGSRSMIRVKVSDKTGSANASFVVPASTNGNHRVSAIGNKSSATYDSYRTKASAYVGSGLPEPNALVRVQIRGFDAGEAITFRYDTQAGTVLGSATASATGSGSHSVRIPGSSTTGKHYLWVLGDQGNSIRITLTVSAGSVPIPTATATGTAMATETPTHEPSATPTSVPTDVPTEVAPTETPTSEPTEMPTDVPTDEPPTETVIPVETATEISTPIPTVEEPTETATLETQLSGIVLSS